MFDIRVIFPEMLNFAFFFFLALFLFCFFTFIFLASDDDKLEVTEQALKQFFGKEIVKALRKSIEPGRSIMKGIRLSCLASTKPKSNYLAQKPGRLTSGPFADVQTTSP